MLTTGFNHLALVARDMGATVDFYTRVLDMPLVKTIALPGGGQHFFFDCGGGASLAFFWWPETPAAAPGIASVARFPHDAKTAVGSMNHVAFAVAPGDLGACIDRLAAAGVEHFPVILNHDDSAQGVALEMHDGVFVRSVYFTDPNGIMMEFAAWTRPFTGDDVRHAAAGATVEV